MGRKVFEWVYLTGGDCGKVVGDGCHADWFLGFNRRMIGGDAPLASSLLFRIRSGASLDVTDTGVSAAIEAVNATASFVMAGHFDFQADDCQVCRERQFVAIGGCVCVCVFATLM